MTTSTRRHWLTAAACASVLAAGLTAYAPDAAACGGLFCNTSQPVNQAAERIIFSDNPDNTVTAVVQIMYDGPSERFAWVLPVPGSPEVGVSSTQAFDRLQQATNPSYRMNTTVTGDCKSSGVAFAGADSANADGQRGGGANNGTGGVQVVDSGHVGPYDYTTISVDNQGDDPAQTALDWLGQNNYDVTALGESTIRPYLEDGMNLLAFRLSKDSETGDIRPIRITYDAELPMIPIKLTAVAANDDMGVLVWVLSEHRAIPSNYKSLRLNEAAINWFNPASNYNTVINRAADEADGQGFVTELAWPTDRGLPTPNQFSQPQQLDGLVFMERDRQTWQQISTQDWTGRDGELIARSMQFRNWDGYLKVVEATVPLPASTSAQDFANCTTNACDSLTSRSNIEGFDAATFVEQMKLQVIDPIRKTQDLLTDRPYMTRLYTTMSAAEMTLDPVFDFNADLGDHSNVHVAERTIECGDQDYERSDAPWYVELPQGDTVFGKGNSWPLSADADGLPATRQIVQEHNSGQGEVVEDNTGAIDSFVQDNNQRIRDEFSGGCQVTNPASATLARNVALALMFGAFGMLFWRRRRD